MSKNLKEFIALEKDIAVSQNSLISILIPTYNVEQYINRCIDSALNQTYKNIEIIVVDDGSTDKTLKILKKYNSSKIKVYTIAHSGAAVARNKCFEKASGKYIFWLDSDDYLDEETIEYCHKVLIYENADAVRIDFTSESAGIITMNQAAYMRLVLTDHLKSFITATLMKKELLTGLKYENGQLIEDYQLYPKICKRMHKLSLIRKKDLYFYTSNRFGSTTQTTAYKPEGLYPRAVLAEKRYDEFLDTYPEECKTVLWQFAKYAVIYCLLTYNKKEYKKQYDYVRQLLLSHEYSLINNPYCSKILKREVVVICKNYKSQYIYRWMHTIKREAIGIHHNEKK